MQQHSQTVFMIEQLQPSWLTKRALRVVYMLGSRMVPGLIFVILGLMFALGSNLLGGENLKLVDQIFFGLIIGLIFAVAYGLCFVVVLFVAWGISAFRSAHRSVKSDITTVETLRWSRADIQKGLVWGLYSLLIFGAIAWLLFG
jgi:hypothetical protein